jgi:transcriptional regulator with XRE-family HTH domain
MDRHWKGSLARASKFYVNQFESVSKAGSAKVLKALAGVLQVDMDDLMAN